jgi:cysteine desulfurase
MPNSRTPVYLDCNATTPIEPEVEAECVRFLREEFGNAGSRTHEFGNRAKQAVQRARDQVAAVVRCQREEVIFTSGATESNNLALLGLRDHAERTGRRHLIATAIEHKAVLEPLEYLVAHGFELTKIHPDASGAISVAQLSASLRPETVLVSVMHVNNETGIIQPLSEIADAITSHPAFFHVDAAQGFGKLLDDLKHPRLDLISISGHKIYAPKGIGALVTRRRGYERPPLTPLMFGGGQERGLRPGTLPVELIAALGKAAELAVRDQSKRRRHCQQLKEGALKAFTQIGGIPIGDQTRAVPSTLNITFPGLDSEAAMLALKEFVAISNGSACTSQNYSLSHVLTAMGLPEAHIRGALRLSWSHLTPKPPWNEMTEVLRNLNS